MLCPEGCRHEHVVSRGTHLAMHVGVHETPRDIIHHVRAGRHCPLRHLSIKGIH